jgi:hypothetical protein
MFYKGNVWGHEYVVDANGNIFKNNVFVPASNYAYLPTNVIENARMAKQQQIEKTVITPPQVEVTQTIENPEEEKRASIVAKLILSELPEIASLQKISQEIFIKTGSWQTEEQKKLHEEAENIRKNQNPLYTGSVDGSTETKFILGPSEVSGLNLPKIPLTLVALGGLLLLLRR